MTQRAVNTQNPLQVEGLNEIFMRKRPDITNLWPEVFKLDKSSIICIRGLSASGKSMMCMELMARVLSSNEKAEILHIDAEKTFKILKFSEICCKYTASAERTQMNLERLICTTCSSINWYSVTDQLKSRLEENNNISLVVIDSVGLFYYSAVAENQRITRESYINRTVEKLNIFSKKYRVTFVYTLPAIFEGQLPTRFNYITHCVDLKKVDINGFLMRVTTSDQVQQVLKFSIGKDGIRDVAESSQRLKISQELESEEMEI